MPYEVVNISPVSVQVVCVQGPKKKRVSLPPGDSCSTDELLSSHQFLSSRKLIKYREVPRSAPVVGTMSVKKPLTKNSGVETPKKEASSSSLVEGSSATSV